MLIALNKQLVNNYRNVSASALNNLVGQWHRLGYGMAIQEVNNGNFVNNLSTGRRVSRKTLGGKGGLDDETERGLVLKHQTSDKVECNNTKTCIRFQ